MDLLEGIRGDSKLRDQSQAKDCENTSLSDTEDLGKVDEEIQTDNLKRRDNFAQTDKHGYLKLVNMIELDKHISHTLTRKLSTKTTLEFGKIESFKEQNSRKLTEIEGSEDAFSNQIDQIENNGDSDGLSRRNNEIQK